MSYIKQKSIVTITSSTPLSYMDMGDVILNASAPITISIPNATNAQGLWYEFINIGSESAIINDAGSNLVTTVNSGFSSLIISDNTSWIKALSGEGGDSHNHSNLSYLDSIDQNLMSSATPTFASIKLGDVGGGNYLEVENDGTWQLYGDGMFWDEVQPSCVSFGLGATPPSMTIYNTNLKAYEFIGVGATPTEIYVSFPIPHTYKEGGSIVPNLKLYVPDDLTGGDIKFECDWTWTNLNAVESTPTTYYGIATIDAEAGNLNKLLPINSDTFSGSGKTIGSILSCCFRRNPEDVEDTFDASVWLKSVGLKIPIDTGGSRTESEK
jgi:hypothetical protein